MKKLLSLYFTLIILLSAPALTLHGMEPESEKSNYKDLIYMRLENNEKVMRINSDKEMPFDQVYLVNFIESRMNAYHYHPPTEFTRMIDGKKITVSNQCTYPFTSLACDAQYDQEAPDDATFIEKISGTTYLGPMGWYANDLLQTPKAIYFLAHSMAWKEGGPYQSYEDYKQIKGKTGLYRCNNVSDLISFMALFHHLVKQDNGFSKIERDNPRFVPVEQILLSGDGDTLQYDETLQMLAVKNKDKETIFEWSSDKH